MLGVLKLCVWLMLCDSVFYILNWFLCIWNFVVHTVWLRIGWLIMCTKFGLWVFDMNWVGLWYCIGCYSQTFGFSDSNVYANMFLWLVDEMEGLVMIVLSFGMCLVVFVQEQWRNTTILTQARHSRLSESCRNLPLV